MISILIFCRKDRTPHSTLSLRTVSITHVQNVPIVQVGLKPGDREMVVDVGGHFSPAGIDGVHTCLYYYRPLQHMTVPSVIQYNTYTLQ